MRACVRVGSRAGWPESEQPHANWKETIESLGGDRPDSSDGHRGIGDRELQAIEEAPRS